MFERVLNNTNSYFDESYSLQLWIQLPSLITPYSTLQLSYGEWRYLKQVLENYRFSQNFRNDAYGKCCGSSCLRYYDALCTKIDKWFGR